MVCIGLRSLAGPQDDNLLTDDRREGGKFQVEGEVRRVGAVGRLLCHSQQAHGLFMWIVEVLPGWLSERVWLLQPSRVRLSRLAQKGHQDSVR